MDKKPLKTDMGSEFFRALFPGLFGNMRVDVHRCLNIRVAEPLLHFLDGYSGFKKQAAMRMAQAVSGDNL